MASPTQRNARGAALDTRRRLYALSSRNPHIKPEHEIDAASLGSHHQAHAICTLPNMAPRRSRKAGKLGAGADRRRQRQLEQGALRDLQATCDELSTITEPNCEFVGRFREGAVRLNLSECRMIALPDSIGGLKALTELDLSKCRSLVALPDSIGDLKALTTLVLAGCSSLTELPDTIGGLRSLTGLDMIRCESLVELPESIGGLGALKHLSLFMCSKLVSLPKTIGDLKALTVLDLSQCESLTALPTTIVGLTVLTALGLSGCKSLTALPPCMEAMTQLTVEGWVPPPKQAEKPLSGFALFSKLATPFVKAKMTFSTDNVMDDFVRENWDMLPELNQATFHNPCTEELLRNVVRKMMHVTCNELRKMRRRQCDACGRHGTFEEDRFPVCWCGARRYCGEECQKADWAAGHSRTCASGATWSDEDLTEFREVEDYCETSTATRTVTRLAKF